MSTVDTETLRARLRYERLTSAIARDERLRTLLDALPPDRRLPNLLLAVVKYHGGPVDSVAAFRDYVVEHWSAVKKDMRVRMPQTNEVGRCAVLLPVLAALPQPLALLEVGASAGLCLYLDRYGYRYGDRLLGSGEPLLECEMAGQEPPTRMPEVVWRAGLDLHPLDITDSADLAWLEANVWPENPHRLERLRTAAAIAAADPPLLVKGDLVTDLPALAACAPAGVTLVVFHSTVLYLVPKPERDAFAEAVRGIGCRWLANEAPGVLDHGGPPSPPHGPGGNILALDGVPLAWTRWHGQAMTWFANLGTDIVHTV